jgi:hypothetical protein
MAKKLRKVCQLYCSTCEVFIDETSNEVDFQNISEDWEGKDLVTYIHKTCGLQQESRRFG